MKKSAKKQYIIINYFQYPEDYCFVFDNELAADMFNNFVQLYLQGKNWKDY